MHRFANMMKNFAALKSRFSSTFRLAYLVLVSTTATRKPIGAAEVGKAA